MPRGIKIDMTGQRLGKLFVLGPEIPPGRTKRWRVRCDCGVEKLMRADYLREKNRSCGCSRVASVTRHGHSGKRKTRAYRAWQSMIRRCHCERDKDFDKYGGRGIRVCDRWRGSFEAFLSDMGEPPDGMSLDRRDVNGPYAADNCRWAGALAQSANRRSAVLNYVGVCLLRHVKRRGATTADLVHAFDVSPTTVLNTACGKQNNGHAEL